MREPNGIAKPRPAFDALRLPALGPPPALVEPSLATSKFTETTGRCHRAEEESRSSQEARCAVAQVRRSSVVRPRPDEICSVCPVTNATPQNDARSFVLYLSD